MKNINLRRISLLATLVIGVSGVKGLDSNKIYPARENTTYKSRYGYINQEGEWVVSPTYDYAYPFSDGYGVVSRDDRYGVINQNGKEVIPLNYSNLTPFEEERAIFNNENGVGVIDTKGQVVTSEYYQFIQDYEEGLAVVAKTVHGQILYGYIDLEGKEVIEPKYLSVGAFAGDKALVKISENQYGLIDKKGHIKQTFQYPLVYGYSEGMLIYGDQLGGKVGYLNEEGKELIPIQYEIATPFKDGVAVVGESFSYDSKQGLINNEGKEIYPFEYNNIVVLGEDRVALGKAIDEEAPDKGSLYAIGDLKGKVLTDFKFHNIGEYKDGVASASSGDATYFIDRKGQHIEDFPIIAGDGSLEHKGDVVAANIDYITFYYNDKGILIYTPSEDVNIGKGRIVQAIKYAPNINYIVYYGQLKGLPNKEVEKSINQKLEQEAKKDGIKSSDQLEYTFYSNFAIPFSKKHLLVVDTMDSIYYFGAAHPNSDRKVEMIDLETGTFYELKDLFKADSNWQEQLESIIRKQTTEEPFKSILYVSPEKIIVEEGQGFYVDEDNLYIFYDPYEIGPYAAGYITFKIPYEQIKENIDIESGFWKSFN